MDMNLYTNTKYRIKNLTTENYCWTDDTPNGYLRDKPASEDNTHDNFIFKIFTTLPDEFEKPRLVFLREALVFRSEHTKLKPKPAGFWTIRVNNVICDNYDQVSGCTFFLLPASLDYVEGYRIADVFGRCIKARSTGEGYDWVTRAKSDIFQFQAV